MAPKRSCGSSPRRSGGQESSTSQPRQPATVLLALAGQMSTRRAHWLALRRLHAQTGRERSRWSAPRPTTCTVFPPITRRLTITPSSAPPSAPRGQGRQWPPIAALCNTRTTQPSRDMRLNVLESVLLPAGRASSCGKTVRACRISAAHIG
jgi:hypothetical protein